MFTLLKALTLSFSLVLACSTAMAKKPPLTLSFSEPADRIAPSGESMYSVKIECKKSGEIKKIVTSSFVSDLFVAKKTTVSHVVFFSKELPEVANSKIVMPTLPLSVINVFSTDGESEVDGFKVCNRYFLISGNRRIFVTGVFNYSKQYKPGGIFKVVDSVTKILTPLSTLFGGVAPVAALTGINNSVQQVAQPMQALLQIFNEGENRATSVRLFTGVTTLTTRVGTITFTTKPLTSISEDANSDFLGDLQVQLTAIAAKPASGANLAQTCNELAVGLAQSGITAMSDIAYSLVYLSSKQLNNPKDLLTCLVNRRYALAAAKLPAKLFTGYPNFASITEATVNGFYGFDEQPQYIFVVSKMDDLLAYLSQYARNVPRPPVAAKRLRALFSSTLIVEDKTSGPLGGFDDTVIDPLQAMDKLVQLGFLRFGCYTATAPETGSDVDHAIAMFLMFRTDEVAKQTPINNVVGVRPYFDSNLQIAKLVLTDRIDWVKAVLAPRANNCNGFGVVINEM